MLGWMWELMELCMQHLQLLSEEQQQQQAVAAIKNEQSTGGLNRLPFSKGCAGYIVCCSEWSLFN